MKIALVHDDFCQSGGAEILFAQIAQIFPKAPIYTALISSEKIQGFKLGKKVGDNEKKNTQSISSRESINKEAFPHSTDIKRVRTSFMQKIPLAPKFFKVLLPLYPLAFESFDFSKYDLVISSTTRFSKGIITKPATIHICYINSLPRFLWSQKATTHYLPRWARYVLKPYFIWLKDWDRVAASRPDFYIANSQNVADQVKKDYGRDAKVVYPFADTDFFTPPKTDQQSTINPLRKRSEASNQQLSPYFLVVSRLVKWKKIDIAIKACAELKRNLIIVGSGPDKKRLKKLAQLTINIGPQSSKIRRGPHGTVSKQSTIDFEGHVSREKLRELYQNAVALITTQEEDFGISTVEAQACGIPVIAYAKGGQREIVVEGKTGLFFDSQSQKSLEDAILRFYKVKWTISACRENSLKFSKAVFEKKFTSSINSLVKNFNF